MQVLHCPSFAVIISQHLLVVSLLQSHTVYCRCLLKTRSVLRHLVITFLVVLTSSSLIKALFYLFNDCITLLILCILIFFFLSTIISSLHFWLLVWQFVGSSYHCSRHLNNNFRLPWNLVQTFIVPWGRSPLALAIPWLLLWHHQQLKGLIFLMKYLHISMMID